MSRKKPIIQKITSIVKKELSKESTGHDWWHIERVWKMAKRIAKEEKVKVDMFVVEAAALLHDIADWKFYKGDDTVGPTKASSILSSCGVPKPRIDHIVKIIKDISFKGINVSSQMKTTEGKIVQDADRLDALGAIGIARTFAYGGKIGNPIHDPTLKPHYHETFEEYKSKRSSSINHFYEKLLLLKNLMNTKTAKKIAERRQNFMETFLRKFYLEWEEEL